MKDLVCLLSCAVVAAVLASSCTSAPDAVAESAQTPSDPISNQVHASINHYRVSLGKKPLTRHSGLDRLAAQHSRYMLANSGRFSLHGKKISHYGFENRVLAARRLYSMDTVAENVAAGRVDTAHAGDGLLRLWQKSKSHHKQLLEDWTHTGIGSAVHMDGTVYSTQLFASHDFSRQPVRDRFSNR